MGQRSDTASGDGGNRSRVGRLAAAVTERGGQPRRRAMDLVIAATANVIGVVLMTQNIGDFEIIDDLVDVRSPEQLRHS